MLSIDIDWISDHRFYRLNRPGLIGRAGKETSQGHVLQERNLAERTVKYGPLNQPITPRVLTEKYNETFHSKHK